MNKNLKNNLILITILSFLIIFKVIKDRSNYTSSELIFKLDKNKINKIIIYNSENSIELLKVDEYWKILGNDSLIVSENKINDFFDKILLTKKETLLSENIDKWSALSVDDSSGTHLEIYDKVNKKLAHYVVGRSKKDWKHNNIRINKKPQVYITNQNIINNLSTLDSYWGEKLKPIKVDSLETPSINIKENK